MASIGFKDLLLKITDSSRIGPGEFIFKELGTRTLQQVLMTLSVAHLNEIPVYITQKMVYNVFGLWDLLPCIMKIMEEGRDTDAPCPPSENALLSIKASFHRKLRFSVAETLADTPSLHPFVPIESVHCLYEVVECMLENNHTQISITTDNNVLLNVITAELLVRFIYINRLRLHPWYFALTVAELDLGGKEPLGIIQDTDPAVDAFSFMHKKQTSCVAVVDSEKKIVGCINLNDLQVIFKPKRSIADLFLPAMKYIELGVLLSRGVIPAPFATCATCTKDTTMGEIVNHAIRNRAWNFFLLNPDNSVARVISARDIITVFFNTKPPPSGKVATMT